MHWNYYNYYNNDLKNEIRNADYISIITNMISSMFVFNGISQEYGRHLIKCLIMNGTAYIKPTTDGKAIICMGNYADVPDADEIVPRRYVAVKNNFEFDGIPDDTTETIAYMTPDRYNMDIVYRFASQFAEIDTSLVNNIQFSRIAPICVVPDDTTKAQYEKCLKDMLSGQLENTVRAGFRNLDGTSQTLDMISISDANHVEKIQYLSMYHEQMISRLCKLFGVSYSYISKQANITSDELHNGDDFCKIYPSIMRDCLNESLNKIGISVDFADVLKWIDEPQEVDTNVNNEEHEEQEEQEEHDNDNGND